MHSDVERNVKVIAQRLERSNGGAKIVMSMNQKQQTETVQSESGL